MITVFYGDDRAKIQQETKRILGSDYEVFDGENLKIPDIYNICQGNSLFEETRKILIKDLTPAKVNGGVSADGGSLGSGSADGDKLGSGSADGDNSGDEDSGAGSLKNPQDPYEVFSQFVDTKHTIVIWESNVPNRKSYRDFIKKVAVKKFEKQEFDKWASFRIFDLAYTNGKKAVTEVDRLLSKVEAGGEVKMLDPYLMVGAFSSSVLKKFEQSPTVKNKKVLKELSKLDMQMKTSRIEPWMLVKMFLLKVEKL